MGNWTKNRQLISGGTSIGMPSGTAGTRPLDPGFGQFRFNTDTASVEFYNGSIWITLAAGGGVAYTVDSLVGDGSTTVFTMSIPESQPQQLIVFVGSVYQIPTTNYTVNGGYDITFASAPPNGLPINVIHSTS